MILELNKKTGATLIEMIIMMILMLVLISGSAAGLSYAKRGKEAKSTAERLKARLMEARSQAITPLESFNNLQKVKVEFDLTGDNHKVIIYHCTVLPNCTESSQTPFKIAKELKLEAFDNLSQDGANKYYYTYSANDPLHSGQITNVPSANQDVKFDLKNQSSGEVYHFSLDAITGSISVTH